MTISLDSSSGKSTVYKAALNNRSRLFASDIDEHTITGCSDVTQDNGICQSFVVGSFDVDQKNNTLGLGDQIFTVEPLVMDVLYFLAKSPHQVISRDQLISHVWTFNPGADESLTRAISLLRQIFRKDTSGIKYIETVWKRGYKLNTIVEHHDPVNQNSAVLDQLLDRSSNKSDYSVAVLGFENMSGLEDDRFLADGITRDLTMLLGRAPRLRVAAYNSATMFHEGSSHTAEIASKLGVRYIVSGTLTRQGDVLCVRLALMDSASNEQVWANKVTVDINQFYEVESSILLDLSTAMSSELQLAHITG